MADQNQDVGAGGNGSEPYDPSKDPKRKASSGDPGWKYGYWDDINRRDKIRCTFCGIDVYAGIARFKRHLAGASTKGKKNTVKCKLLVEFPKENGSSRKTTRTNGHTKNAIKKEDHVQGQGGISIANYSRLQASPTTSLVLGGDTNGTKSEKFNILWILVALFLAPPTSSVVEEDKNGTNLEKFSIVWILIVLFSAPPIISSTTADVFNG